MLQPNLYRKVVNRNVFKVATNSCFTSAKQTKGYIKGFFYEHSTNFSSYCVLAVFMKKIKGVL